MGDVGAVGDVAVRRVRGQDDGEESEAMELVSRMGEVKVAACPQDYVLDDEKRDPVESREMAARSRWYLMMARSGSIPASMR